MNLNLAEIATLRWTLIIGAGLLSLTALYLVSKFRPGWLQKRDLTRFDLIVGVVAALFAGSNFTNLWHERESVIVDKFHQTYHDNWWASAVRKTFWLGQPLLKTPFDLWVFQEIVHERAPDLVIETGTWQGGTAFYCASLFDLMDKGRVVTVDIKKFPTPEHGRIEYLIGSSTAPEIINQIRERIRPGERVMVTLDSDHSREHVLSEMRLYSRFVTPGDYMVVEDTHLNGRPVRLGDGDPWAAVQDFLAENDDFVVDTSREKFGMSWNRGGWLKRRGGKAQVAAGTKQPGGPTSGLSRNR